MYVTENRCTLLKLMGTLLEIVAPPAKMDKNAFKEGVGVHGVKPAPPDKSKIGIEDPLATMCGLVDKFQLESVQEYLWRNGKNTLQTVSTLLIITGTLLKKSVHY